MKFHMLFEQSGTFKNVFKQYGHEAFDYDILDDYGQTDFKIDLFKEIEAEYEIQTKYNGFCKSHKTIFSSMNPDKDFIIAFFPCTYFSQANENLFKCYWGTNKEPDTSKNGIERLLKRNKDRAYFYEMFIKFCFICQELKIPTIIENPAGANFLKQFSPYQPQWYEQDRSKFGDIFKKPTLFWGINFDLKENFQMFDKEYNTQIVWNTKFGKERSEITPRYADNFYKRFIQNQIKEV